MNIDSFKARLISATGADFSWKEHDGYKGDGANIYAEVYLPNFPAATIDVYLHSNSLEVWFRLNQVRANTDTLLLMNDFNKNVDYFKAFMFENRRGESYLVVSSNQIYVPDEDSGVKAFQEILKGIFSEEVNTYFRPLTIIAK